MTETAPMTAPQTRRHDIDWLRVLAVYLLFVFHVAMVFNPAPFYHIRNGELSFVLLIVAGFISLWHMPLFFLLAGWSAYASLEARGTAAFAKERLLKLWVPLVMGCVLLMPPIKFLELRSGLDANYTGLYVSPALQPSFAPVIPAGLPVMAPFDESFLAFLPTFFTQLDRFTWSHLWFVAYLLVFTLLYLPAFRWLRARRGTLAHAPGWWIYLPIVPLALVQVTLRPHWPGLQNLYDDWANVGYYSTYLLAGFLLARYSALECAAHHEWWRALGVGLAATLVLLLGVLGFFEAPSVMLAGYGRRRLVLRGGPARGGVPLSRLGDRRPLVPHRVGLPRLLAAPVGDRPDRLLDHPPRARRRRQVRAPARSRRRARRSPCTTSSFAGSRSRASVSA